MNLISKVNPHILSCTIAITLGIAALTAPPPVRAMTVHDPIHTIRTIAADLRRHQESISAQITRAKTLLETIKMYENMVRQGLTLGDEIFDMVQSPINDLIDLYNDAKKRARSIGDIDREFRERYSGYGDYMKAMLGGTSPYNMSNSHSRFSRVGARPVSEPSKVSVIRHKETETSITENWHEETSEVVIRALGAANIPINAFENDEAALKKLRERSSKAEGRMQALQAGNEIASMLLEQMIRLNVLVGEQLKFHADQAAQQNERATIAATKRQLTQGDAPKRATSIGWRAN